MTQFGSKLSLVALVLALVVVVMMVSTTSQAHKADWLKEEVANIQRRQMKARQFVRTYARDESHNQRDKNRVTNLVLAGFDMSLGKVKSAINEVLMDWQSKPDQNLKLTRGSIEDNTARATIAQAYEDAVRESLPYKSQLFAQLVSEDQDGCEYKTLKSDLLSSESFMSRRYLAFMAASTKKADL